MHKIIGSYEAKTHLPALLDEVEQGEEIIITRKGKPIAILLPYRENARLTEQTIEALFAHRKSIFLKGLSVREMIDEGKKY